MITYEPFWDTLGRSKESTYSLIKKHHISSATIDRLRNNKAVNTGTINTLCEIFGCGIDQIMSYAPAEDTAGEGV